MEVDGAAHRGSAKPYSRRDRCLGKQGYRTLRLDANLVLRDPANAVARLLAALAGG